MVVNLQEGARIWTWVLWKYPVSALSRWVLSSPRRQNFWAGSWLPPYAAGVLHCIPQASWLLRFGQTLPSPHSVWTREAHHHLSMWAPGVEFRSASLYGNCFSWPSHLSGSMPGSLGLDLRKYLFLQLQETEDWKEGGFVHQFSRSNKALQSNFP